MCTLRYSTAASKNLLVVMRGSSRSLHPRNFCQNWAIATVAAKLRWLSHAIAARIWSFGPVRTNKAFLKSLVPPVRTRLSSTDMANVFLLPLVLGSMPIRLTPKTTIGSVMPYDLAFGLSYDAAGNAADVPIGRRGGSVPAGCPVA